MGEYKDKLLKLMVASEQYIKKNGNNQLVSKLESDSSISGYNYVLDGKEISLIYKELRSYVKKDHYLRVVNTTEDFYNFLRHKGQVFELEIAEPLSYQTLMNSEGELQHSSNNCLIAILRFDEFRLLVKKYLRWFKRQEPFTIENEVYTTEYKTSSYKFTFGSSIVEEVTLEEFEEVSEKMKDIIAKSDLDLLTKLIKTIK